ncbi:MAG: STAS/SEC14 domain-containing protein [Verrucomicrobiales bacterium]|nr:STAS/SEC14 domain-containing protein [Verrucomicrobiales bacterium]
MTQSRHGISIGIERVGEDFFLSFKAVGKLTHADYGLKHGSEFERVAIFGKQKWLGVATGTGSWFMGGEAKFFEGEEEAIGWLQS